MSTTENPLGGLPADEVNELDDQHLPAQPFMVDEGKSDVRWATSSCRSAT